MTGIWCAVKQIIGVKNANSERAMNKYNYINFIFFSQRGAGWGWGRDGKGGWDMSLYE